LIKIRKSRTGGVKSEKLLKLKTFFALFSMFIRKKVYYGVDKRFFAIVIIK